MPLMVDKLILEFEANGRANFPRFVRAFEDYFASITVPAEPVRCSQCPSLSPSLYSSLSLCMPLSVLLFLRLSLSQVVS